MSYLRTLFHQRRASTSLDAKAIGWRLLGGRAAVKI